LNYTRRIVKNRTNDGSGPEPTNSLR